MSETPEPGDDIQPGPPQPQGEDQTPYGQAPYGQAPYGQGTEFGQEASFGQGAAYGQPWAQPVPADPQTMTGPAPILVSFAGPQKQNRLTVAFRLILVIPHLVVLLALGIALEVVAFLGWWAALFTGRLPQWAHEFITGVLRWSTRVNAYYHFLTDEYPPFSLEDADYPIRLVTKQTRLNRLAVLFRIILAIPAWLLASVALVGMAILSFFAWLITLIAGRLPAGLHQAFAAILRFYARFSGYAFLVTPDYPGGLFGDKTAPAGSAVAEPAGPGVAAPPADPWRLTLSSGGRTLVTVGLVVGALGFAGYIAGIVAVTGGSINNTVQRANADATVTSSYNKLGTVLSSFQAKTQACQQNISCVTALDTQVAQAFQTFENNLATAGVPSSFTGDATILRAATNKVVNDFNQLATAQSASQYTSIIGGLSLQSDLSQWQGAFDKLHTELNRP